MVRGVQSFPGRRPGQPLPKEVRLTCASQVQALNSCVTQATGTHFSVTRVCALSADRRAFENHLLASVCGLRGLSPAHHKQTLLAAF